MSAPSRPMRDEVRELALGEIVVPWRTLWPLWRLAALIAVIAALATVQLFVRLEVGEVTADIGSTADRLRAAQTAQERLKLELAIRRGADHLQSAATTYGMTEPTRVSFVAQGRTP